MGKRKLGAGLVGRTVRLPSGMLASVLSDQNGELEVRTLSDFGRQKQFSIRREHAQVYSQRFALGLTDRVESGVD